MTRLGTRSIRSIIGVSRDPLVAEGGELQVQQDSIRPGPANRPPDSQQIGDAVELPAGNRLDAVNLRGRTGFGLVGIQDHRLDVLLPRQMFDQMETELVQAVSAGWECGDDADPQLRPEVRRRRYDRRACLLPP